MNNSSSAAVRQAQVTTYPHLWQKKNKKKTWGAAFNRTNTNWMVWKD